MTLYELLAETYPNWKNPDNDTVIRAFESNLYLTDQQVTPGTPDYDLLLKFTSDYAVALTEKPDHKKTGTYLEKAIDLWEGIGYAKDELIGIEYYRVLRYHRAVTFFNIGKLNRSKKEFEQLIADHPEIKNFQKWRYYIKNKMWARISYVVMAITAAAFCIKNFFGIDSRHIRCIIGMVEGAGGISLLSMALLGSYYSRRIKAIA